MLKMALFDCAINKKMLQCWQRTGHLPSFFVRSPGDLTAQESPPSGNLPSKAKKMLTPGVSPGVSRGGGGWAQVTDALIEKLTFLGIGCESKGAFKSHSRPEGPWQDQSSFENELRSFQEFFAEKLYPCILFMIWLIWLDSFDKKWDSFWLVRSEKRETPQAIDWVLQDVQKLKQSKY